MEMEGPCDSKDSGVRPLFRELGAGGRDEMIGMAKGGWDGG
jgi:hypothetical protein